jgi:Zn-dependent protease
MNSRLELGRIAGVEIHLDMFFLLILFIFSSHYFTGGDSQMMSMGLLIIAGLVGSILLHEFGHAIAARAFKVRVSHIDLTGLGGVIHFASSLPRGGLARAAIYLAGPGVNYLLSVGCSALGSVAAGAGKPLVAMVLLQLAMINSYLMWFNLLPAYPLDGGHTLDALLGKVVGSIWAQRVVAILGMIVAALMVVLAIKSLPGSIFLLMLAVFIADANWTAFNQVGGFGGRR